jgi:hypothetical protein
MRRLIPTLLVALLLGCSGSSSGSGDVTTDTHVDTPADADAVTPDTAEPDTAEPDLAEPDTAEPDVAEPECVGADLCVRPDANDTAEPQPDLPPPVCPVDGVACDDGDPCTFDDRCLHGACGGTGYACDDGRPCTDDACDGAGSCTFARKDGWCLINGQCVQNGKGLPGNWCTKCLEDVDPWGWTMDAMGDCVDDDPCTTNERCEAGKCLTEPLVCDDGNPCTTDSCAAGAGCQYVPNFLACDNGDVCDQGDICIDGQCVGGDQKLDCDDDSDCTADACDPVDGCKTTVLEGTPCDDADVCTDGDTCAAGTCLPGPLVHPCDDGNACTADSCHPIAGCLHKTLENNICCKGGLSHCDDKNPCTTDVCDPETGSCTYQNNTASCDDGDACTSGDLCAEGTCLSGGPTDCDDHNDCTVDACDSFAGCLHTAVAGACDDADLCTTGDVCVSGKCVGEAKYCDDGEICTANKCEPTTGQCFFPPNNAPCDDASICTLNDHCANGACTGTPLPCDDGDPCTTDSCNKAVGCLHAPFTGPCDDGLECSVNDKCTNGVCAGDDSLCTNCPPTFATLTSKFNYLAIGTKGIPGEGLDIDGNAATCSPTPGCSGGIDNAMSKFAGIANGQITKPMEEGQIVILFEHTTPNLAGTPYQINMYAGKPVDETCDIMNAVCDYWVDPATMTPDCYPLVFFDNFKAKDGKFTAGGQNYIFPIDLPLIPGVPLKITLFYARMEGTYTVANGKLDTLDGILGGAINKQEVVDIINNLPPDALGDFPMTKDQLLNLLNSLLPTDMDTNADGVKDGASMGLKFKAIRGNLVGLKPE